MILLPVDEAYAFDYLSILMVKRDCALPVDAEISRVEIFLAQQLRNFDVILKSVAFKRLTTANQSTFAAIEAAHQNKITARRVQEINYSRFEAKRLLQEEFWPKTPMGEKKTSLTKRQLTLKRSH